MDESDDDSDYEYHEDSGEDASDDDDSAISWDGVDDNDDDINDEERRMILQEYYDAASDEEESSVSMSTSESLPDNNEISTIRSSKRKKTKLHHLIDELAYEEAIGHVREHPSDAEVQDREGWTPLHIMVQQDVVFEADCDTTSPFVVLFRELLRLHPDATTAKDSLSNTPLHILVGGGLRSVRPWVSLGLLGDLVQANPTSVSIVSLDGTLPLHDALSSFSRDPEVDYDPNKKDNTTVLQKTLIKVLLEAYPRATFTQDGGGMLPLHTLCRHGSSCVDVEIYKMILDANPDAAFCVDEYNRFPLHHIMRYLHPVLDIQDSWLEPLQVILEMNPLALEQPDRSGWTPFQEFWFSYEERRRNPDFGHEEQIRILKQIDMVLKTAQHNLIVAKARTGAEASILSLGHDPRWKRIHCAVEVGCLVSWLNTLVQLHRHLLLEKDADGNLPLMIAAMSNATCLECEEDSDDSDSEEGDQGFGVHEDNRPGRVLEMLLEACPQAARIPNGKGTLPLHAAAECGKAWDNGIEILMRAAPQALSTRDTVTHMYPFMLAASSTSADDDSWAAKRSVWTCFELLRACPEVVSHFL